MAIGKSCRRAGRLGVSDGKNLEDVAIIVRGFREGRNRIAVVVLGAGRAGMEGQNLGWLEDNASSISQSASLVRLSFGWSGPSRNHDEPG